MEESTRSTSITKILKFWLVVLALVAAFLVVIYIFHLWYTESYGTYRRLTHVADVDNDGNLDVILTGTRWEGVANSFAGAVI